MCRVVTEFAAQREVHRDLSTDPCKCFERAAGTTRRVADRCFRTGAR